jgi:2-phosphosulfolactate phosphatase
MNLEVLFSPADFEKLPQRDLSRSTCVVFDVLRATSTMLTALHHGAAAIIPVAEIAEALALQQQHPQALLAGEREGLRIRAAQTGTRDFDLGNSPREFLPERVAGKTIIMTTTNGTRGLRAAAGAQEVLPGAVLNLGCLISRIRRRPPTELLVVCSGTQEECSYEDTLAAGALCDAVIDLVASPRDSVSLARQVFRAAGADWQAAMQLSRNGRRLLARPELAPDVAFCLQRDKLQFLARMNAEGIIRRCD